MRGIFKLVAACVVSALIAAAATYYLSGSLRGIWRPKAVHSTGVGGLPVCLSGDTRNHVPTWSPSLTKDGDLTEEPPQNDGQVMFIEITGDGDKIGCGNSDKDHLYALSKPNTPGSVDDGGLEVNLRGNVQFHDGLCTFHGFYMNQPVYGMHQGWIETYFKPLDQFEVIKSGAFCSEEAAAPD